MYKYLVSISLCMAMCAANAAPGAAGRGRTSMANQMNAAPRAVVVSKTQVAAASVMDANPDEVSSDVATEVVEEVKKVTRTYKVAGMMCKHCVGRVERALNSIDGIQATVTLEPPVATVIFDNQPLSMEELQQIITEKAGDYQITE